MHSSKIKVLFICVHNSARSQMAEGFLKKLGGQDFIAESAGLEPGEINPLAIDAMKEIGIDLRSQSTNSVFDYYKEGRLYHYVITVCDTLTEQKCPIFPGTANRILWNLDDPAAFEGTYEERLQATRLIRDELENKIVAFINKAHKDHPEFIYKVD